MGVPARDPRDAVADAIADRKRRGPWTSLLTFVLGFGLLVVFVRWLSVNEGLRRRLATRIGQSQRPPNRTSGDSSTTGRSSTPGPWWSSSRSSRPPSRHVPCPNAPPAAPRACPEPVRPALIDVLEETLDDLRAETDPRRAVIAAYARMERALAAYGLPREPVGGAGRVLPRIFADLEVSRRCTSRLTALFAWAKFSGHDVAPEMKQEAIEALEAVPTSSVRPRFSPRAERAQRELASGRAPDAPRLASDPAVATADDRLGAALAIAPPGDPRGPRLAPRHPRHRAPRLPRVRPGAYPRAASPFDGSLVPPGRRAAARPSSASNVGRRWQARRRSTSTSASASRHRDRDGAALVAPRDRPRPDPGASRAVLGEDVWELVRPERPVPTVRHGAGIDEAELGRVVRALERV